MGLDNYWVKPGTDDDFQLNKFWVMFYRVPGYWADGYFRGNIFKFLFEACTGESLYRDRIPNIELRQLAKRLRKAKYEDYKHELSDDMTKVDFREFVRMFSAYTNAGADLTSCF